jgi:hypothetical protein
LEKPMLNYFTLSNSRIRLVGRADYSSVNYPMSASPKLGHLEVSGIANFKW